MSVLTKLFCIEGSKMISPMLMGKFILILIHYTEEFGY